MTNETQPILYEFSYQKGILIDELRALPSGLEWSERYTALVDQLIRRLYTDLALDLGDQPLVTVIATGGYGRRELSPWSDIDLTLVPIDESHPLAERAIKSLFLALQETVARGTGTKIGYALRYPTDAPGLDGKTRSGLLDARVIVGPLNPFTELMTSLWTNFPVAEFLIEKISETESHFQKTNDSPLAVQPDLKVGAGGLRSFQAANWIGAALGERMERPTKQYDHVLACRNILHIVSERLTDRISIARRVDVAKVFGIDALEFGSELAKNLILLHETYIASVRRIHDSRFVLAPHVEAIRGEARIGALATAGNAALGIAHATSLGLVIPDSKSNPRNEAKASEAMLAITNGEQTIRNMERCGVLDVLLPELTACKTLMPQDGSHEFTVFEHTMRVIRNLDNASNHPFFGSIKHEIRDKGPLYLAALLHDVGRIDSESDHAEVGASYAQGVCERLELYSANKETVCWLVREHLSFDRTLRLRDLSDPRTASELADLVQTSERLAMLTLLTWADVSAVSDHTWTTTHDALSQELFHRTLTVLTADVPVNVDGKSQRIRILNRSKDASVPAIEFEKFLDSMPAHYLLATDPESALIHFGFLESSRAGEPTILFKNNKDHGTSEITVCSKDATGLLSMILGVLYANDLSITAIRASTTTGEYPVAIDTFSVSSGGRTLSKAVQECVSLHLRSVILGEINVSDILNNAKKESSKPQQFMTVKFVPGNPGIVEVQAPRGRGMAYRLSRQLTAHGIEIIGARLSQWAGHGAAAFYVIGPKGSQLDEGQITKALSGK